MTHRDDVVPHLPQEALGYLHTPHEAYQKDEVKPDLTYCADSATKEDDACRLHVSSTTRWCRASGVHRRSSTTCPCFSPSLPRFG